MNFQQIIDSISEEIIQLDNPGKVATYIPELGKVPADKFGVHLTQIKDTHFSYGNSDEKFSIQSVAKVFGLALAYKEVGEDIWNRVGVEPSGASFSSIVQLETNEGIPRNPFINAGAIVICDILLSTFSNPKQELLRFIHKASGNTSISFNPVIAASEKSTNFKNMALVNLMKSFGNIHNPIEDVMDFYEHLCAIEMSCKELSRSFMFLAAHGINPCTNEQIISESQAKRINAIMQLCGFYDEAGEFSFRVGLPGKSGVGGGIVAILPSKYSIAIWSPKLNKKGNSFLGMQFLERFTSVTEASIF
jgi:glutaminase